MVEYDIYNTEFKFEDGDERHDIIIWYIKFDDKTKIGNKQITYNEIDEDSVDDRYTVFKNIYRERLNFMYWFDGQSDKMKILHIYQGYSNKKKKNQGILNEIKRDVISEMKITCNEILNDSEDNIDNIIEKNYGQILQKGKEQIKEYLKRPTGAVKNDLCSVLKDTDKNKLRRYLEKSRFEMITALDDSLTVIQRNKIFICILFRDILIDIIDMNHTGDIVKQMKVWTRMMDEKLFNKLKKHPFSILNEIDMYYSLLYRHVTKKQSYIWLINRILKRLKIKYKM